MSDSTRHPAPEYLESHAGSPLSRDRASRRPLVLAGAGVLGLALVGGAAWGAWWWFADGPQAAEALPASTIGYVGLTLDPSGSQKVEALRTLQKFPAIAEELDLDGSPTDIDLREALGTAFMATAPCDGLSYQEHLEPWLGDRLGLGALLVDGEPQPLAVIEATDAEAAEEALAELTTCAAVAGDGEGDFEVRDGWVLLAPDESVLDAAADALDEGTLADDEDFRSWTGRAGGAGIVTAYAAPEAATYLAGALGPAFGQLSGNGYGSTDDAPDPDDQLAQALEDFGGAAAQVRFTGGAAEVELAAGLPAGEGLTDGGDAAALVGSLPDETVVAGGSSIGEELVAQWQRQTADATDGTGGDTDVLTDMADEMLGGLVAPGDLDLPALLGDVLAMAVGPDLDLAGVSSGGTLELPVALVSTGERAAAEEAAAGVGAGMAALLGIEPHVSGEDGRVALGLSPGWTDAVAAGGSLGEQDAYRDALPDAEGAASLLFVDFDALLDVVTSSLSDLGEESDEVVDNLAPLRALGVTGAVDDDTLRVLLRLTTD